MDFGQAIIDRLTAAWPSDGKNIRCTDGPSGRSVNVFGLNGGDQSSDTPCELWTTGLDDTHINIQWGRVNGMQPAQFVGVRTYQPSVTATRYVYVSAEYTLSTGQWDNPQIEISTDATKTNTDTKAYAQIAAVIVDDDGMSVSSACGPIVLNPCDLAIGI